MTRVVYTYYITQHSVTDTQKHSAASQSIPKAELYTLQLFILNKVLKAQ